MSTKIHSKNFSTGTSQIDVNHDGAQSANPYKYDQLARQNQGVQIQDINDKANIAAAQGADEETADMYTSRVVTRRSVNWQVVKDRNLDEVKRWSKRAFSFGRTGGAFKRLFSKQGLQTFPMSLLKVPTALLRDLVEIPYGLVSMADDGVDAGAAAMMNGWANLGRRTVNWIEGGGDITMKNADAPGHQVWDGSMEGMMAEGGMLNNQLGAGRAGMLGGFPGYGMGGYGMGYGGMHQSAFSDKKSTGQKAFG